VNQIIFIFGLASWRIVCQLLAIENDNRKGVAKMSQSMINKIALKYVSNGYSPVAAFNAMIDLGIDFLDCVKVLDAMEKGES
jgi:hypothetical protein